MARNNNQEAHVVVTLDGKQAETMLEQLNKRSAELRNEIKQLNEQRITTGLSGDEAKRFDQLKKDLRETRRTARETSKQVKDVGDVINRLSTAPIKAITDSIKAVETQMKRLDRSTERYAQKREQLRLLREELDRINGNAKESVGAFDQIGKTMKRLASYVFIYTGFNQLTSGLQRIYSMNTQLSDQLADIQKTTGLSGNDLAELSDRINRIDTRTSVEQLNNLAVAAGKLGISAKEDVLGFVEAGNIINVALGEDLGQEAITGLSKLNDILGITKDLGVEKGLLATGSAINELGQSSTANEAYLVDFAQRMGGIAAQANLTIQQVLALGSVTDQLGQNVEVSATALNKFVSTLVSETGQVAKAVGIPLKELQDTLRESTWEGMMLVFEKLAGKGGLAAIAPLMGDLGSDGARLNAVIAALTDDTSRLTNELNLANKAFAEGNSVVREYETKNNNLAGTIEKIGKNIQNWFLDTELIDFMYHFAQGVEEVTRGGQTLREQFEGSVDTFRQLTRNVQPLLDEYERLKDEKTADAQERLKTIMQQIGTAIPSAVSAMDKYGNILSINTERAYAFIEAQKLIMQQSNQDLINNVKGTITELERQFEQAQKRVEEIEKTGAYTIAQFFPAGGGATRIEQTAVTDPKKIRAAQQEMVTLNAELEKQRAILSELTGDYLNEDLENLKKRTEEVKEVVQTVGGEDPEEVIKRQTEAVDFWLVNHKKALLEARENQKDINSQNYISEEEYNQALLALELQALERKLQIIGLEPKEVIKIKDKILEIRQQMADDEIRIQKEIQKIVLDADPVAKENKEYEERLRSLKLYGVDRIDLTKEQLDALLLLEEQHQRKLTDIDRQNREREKRRAEERYKQSVEEQTGINYELWNSSKAIGLEQIQNELDLDVSIGNGTEEELFARQMAIHTMRMQLLQEELEMRNKVGADASKVYQQITDLEGKMMQESVTHFKTLSSNYQQYGSQIGEALGDLITGQENALQGLADSAIDILFDVLDKLANAWIAELTANAVKAQAQGQMNAIGRSGLLGLAESAIISGIITAALTAAKAGIKSAIKGGSSSTSSTSGSGQRVIKTTGYSDGGHTGNGPTLEVAGVVHRGEYVVPKWQMQDPVSFDYVRALETIRRSRSSAHPLPHTSFAEGGPTDSSVSIIPTEANLNNDIQTTLNQLNRLLVKINRDGVRTVFNISNFDTKRQKYENSKARGSLKN